MTLNKRFDELDYFDGKHDYFHDSKKCVEIADEYAIKFLEWCNNHSDDNWKYGKFRNKTSQEILLIFKKEKNL